MSEVKIISKILKVLKIANINNNRVITVAIIAFLVGIFEILSVGLLIPVIKTFINPVEALNSWNALGSFNISSTNQLINIATMIFTLTLILGALLKFILMKLIMNLTFSTGLNITSKIFNNIIYQNYLYHLKNHSSELIDAITMKTNNIVYLAIMPFIYLVSSGLILVLFLLAYFILYTKIAILSTVVIFLFYFLALRFFSKKIKIISSTIAINSSRSIKILQETLDNIKDIILSNNKSYAYNLFYQNEKVYRRSQSEHALITHSPKIIIELLGFLIILFFVFINSSDSDVSYELIPLLATIAFAAQKILPLLAQCYMYWSSLKAQENTVDAVICYLKIEHVINSKEDFKIIFNSSINIINLSYYYEVDSNIIENVNIIINKYSKVCIFGRSGRGKTTLINLILALIYPSSGKITIDGVELNSFNASSWQDKISHVSQNIFIADDTIIRNITLSAINEPLDISRVNSIIEFVGLTDYIHSLPHLGDTILGESGAKLSGGQRQRIGIARALYKNTEIIILDESTNSLDSISEMTILKKLTKLKDKTIIMITHNESNAAFFEETININEL